MILQQSQQQAKQIYFELINFKSCGKCQLYVNSISNSPAHDWLSESSLINN